MDKQSLGFKELKKYWIVLIGAIVLRVVLSLITFQQDIRAFQLGGMVISTGNILNFYDYLGSLPQNTELIKVFGADLFIYPPAIYLVHGLFNFLFSHLGLGIINDYLLENIQTFGTWGYSLHLLLLKLPYFIFDIVGALFITKLFSEKKDKFLAFTLWLFNPISIYATYMVGQFDIIPAVFTVIALFYIRQKRFYLGALFLGIGAAFKIYPILLIMPLLMLEEKWLKRLMISLLGFLPYIISILPFLPSPGFRASALVAGQTLKGLYASIPISGGENILLMPLSLLIAYLYFYYHPGGVTSLWKRFMIILLIFFIFTHYHPQWFVWLTPFFIIDLIETKFKDKLLIILSLISFFGLLFSFNPSSSIGIFAPIYPSLYLTGSAENVWILYNIKIDQVLFNSLLQTLFVSVAVYLIFRSFNSRQNLDD